MATITAIQRRVEYGRFYAEAELTEDGVYIKGQIPETYSGGFIAEIQVCYAVVSVDQSGRLLLTTYNPVDLKDMADESGAAIMSPGQGAGLSGFELRPNTNDVVTEKVILKWQVNTNLPSKIKTTADIMWDTAEVELGTWYV